MREGSFIMRTLVLATCLTLAGLVPAAAQTTKYGVEATVEKGVDFSAFKTYTWTPGQPSPRKSVDESIVAAVDRELKAVGLSPAASGTGDVLVSYFSQQRTDVDLKARPDSSGARPEVTVGSLLVVMMDGTTRKRVLQLRATRPIQDELPQAIDAAVAELFQKYPTRAR
jgi:hypothetical protein